MFRKCLQENSPTHSHFTVLTSVRTSRTDLNWFDIVAKCV